MTAALVVPTLRSVGRMLRDEWSDQGLGPSREFDAAVRQLLESGRDWRWLPGNPARKETRYADAG